MGYYQNPRGASPADIASSIGISRVTLTGHLRSIENHLAALMAKRLNL
jgi:predicted DNA binding protein